MAVGPGLRQAIVSPFGAPDASLRERAPNRIAERAGMQCCSLAAGLWDPAEVMGFPAAVIGRSRLAPENPRHRGPVV